MKKLLVIVPLALLLTVAGAVRLVRITMQKHQVMLVRQTSPLKRRRIAKATGLMAQRKVLVSVAAIRLEVRRQILPVARICLSNVMQS